MENEKEEEKKEEEKNKKRCSIFQVKKEKLD